MNKSSETTEKSNKNERNFLRTLVGARNLPLMLLGLTTLAIVYPMAKMWAESQVGPGFWAFVLTNFLSIIIYGCVDGLLELTLKFLDGTPLPKQGRLMFYGLIAALAFITLVASGTFSMWAAPAISAAMGGDPSQIGNETKHLLAKEIESQQEARKLAGEVAAQSAATLSERIMAAKAVAAKLEREAAAATPHGSWRKDYESAKNKPSHWFWTCKSGASGCPAGYVEYRESILAARAEGAALVASEKGHSPTIAATPSAMPIIKALAEADAKAVGLAIELQGVRTKALVLAEAISLGLVFLITLIVFMGRRAYEIDHLGVSPKTLFSAIGALVAKLSEVAGELYEQFLNSISPQAIREVSALPFTWAAVKLGFNPTTRRQELLEQLAAEQAARQKAEADRQKAEEARRQLEEARRQESERNRQKAYEEELRRQKAETARQEADAARQKAEREAAEAAAELKAQQKQAEAEKKAAEAAAEINRQKEELRFQREEGASRQAADNLRRQKEEERRQKELSAQTKRANPLSDAAPTFKLVGDKIIYSEGEKVSYYHRQKELSALLDLVRKWYNRQKESAKETTRQQNADRYEAAKRFLSAHFSATFSEGASKVEIRI